MKPRPYQSDCITAAARGFYEGFKRQLAVLPTGGGKTIVFAHIADRFWTRRQERTLVLAHREELIEQAADKIHKATGLAASIEKAERHADKDAAVVVASIQSMQRDRLASWATNHFGLVVCDEAHHVLADQWLATVNHFDARVLGVTATPDRGDKKNLATFFDNLAYETNLLDLIRDGYLSNIMVRAVPLKIDLSAIRAQGDDFNPEELSDAIEPYFDVIIQYLKTECAGRKIVVFLPLVATSKKFIAKCQAAGIRSVHVDGKSENRKEILADFHTWDSGLISNPSLLVEGWDEWTVDTVLDLCPTKSRPFYAQKVGRGTRLPEGLIDGLETREERLAAIAASVKPYMLLLDLLWLHEKHNLARPAALVSKNAKEEQQINDALLMKDERDLCEATEAAELEREAALIRELAENSRKVSRYLPIESVAALLKDLKMREYEPTFDWETSAPSAKQREILARFKIKCPATKGEASMLMNKLFARSKDKLATVGQLALLHKFRHPNPTAATAKEAKAFLDARFTR